MIVKTSGNHLSFSLPHASVIEASGSQSPTGKINHSELLSSLVFYRTYAKTLENGRKETEDETVSRVASLHMERFPQFADEIAHAFSYVRRKMVVPSMRSMQFAGDPVKRSHSRMYNCFSRDTEFLTKDGIKSFNDFEDGDGVTVLADKRMWKSATVRKFGKQRLVKLTLSRGRTVEEILTTENHRWITLDTPNTRKEKITTELVVGDILPTNRKTIDLTKPCSVAIQHGIVFGDGTYSKQTGSCLIALCDDSQELVTKFTTGNVLVKGAHGAPVSDRQTYVTDLPYNWKQLPPLTANTDYLFGFLAGWFASDGCVSGNITLASSSKDQLEWARSAFALLGIGTGKVSISRKLSPFTGEPAPLYRINISNESIVPEFFIRTHHKKSFSPPSMSLKWKVSGIELLDQEEDVWCVQEPDTETFTLACGVLTKNCAYTSITSFQDIGDIFFKLMNGCGVGYSVQSRHVSQLPSISHGHVAEFVVEDNKESWSDSMVALLNNPMVSFDYTKVRPQGAKLSTGGTASGPDPLRFAHEKTRALLQVAGGRQLTPLEVHSVTTLTSDCVVVGGVRRAALLCLFDADDTAMLTCKHGNWWIDNPHFGRSNNSAVIHREDPEFDRKLKHVMQMCFESNAGEPGVFLTNDYEYGANPCVEIALRPRQNCNLTEINAAACRTHEDFVEAAHAATVIGTLQATFTDFNYVQGEWKKNCEEDALLGVSITGQAEAWDMLFEPKFLRYCGEIVLKTNELWAQRLGINPAARIGCTKPSGSTSAFLGTTSGIHSAHSEYYLRRVRVDLSDPISTYLMGMFGLHNASTGNIVERDAEKPQSNIVVTVPINKSGSIVRSEETALQLLGRSKYIFDNWIVPTHRSGSNTHNVSLTVSYKEHEKDDIIKWMLENRESYSGISLLPYSDHVYTQPPFEEITEQQYHQWVAKFGGLSVDFSSIDFSGMEDKRGEEPACQGGLCEIK